jgi:hypothetical protein
MVKITWLGEDDPVNDIPGPSWNTWNGIRFPKGQPIEINDAGMIASAKQNQFYRVEEATKPREKIDETQDQSQEQEQNEPTSLEQRAQELKKRLERKEQKVERGLEQETGKKEYHYRQAEKVEGYTPKKRGRKPKTPNPGVATSDT